MANQPNVKRAFVKFNGTEHNATWDAESNSWSVDITAPNESSWSQNGADHAFYMEIHAIDDAGNEQKVDQTDEQYGAQLKVRVLEKTAPVATIVSPTPSSVYGESTQVIQLKLKDTGGSGLNMTTVVFKVNGVQVSNSNLSWSAGDDDDQVASYTAESLKDGSNSVELSVTDNDGNKSNAAKVEFIISTQAPTLTVTTPTDNLITNSTTVTVSGEANPGSTYVTLESVTVNGKNVTSFEASGGAFTYEFTLSEGENTITIVATDSIGKSTQVVRTVILDTKAPVITDIVVTPNPVDANKVIHVTFKITEATE